MALREGALICLPTCHGTLCRAQKPKEGSQDALRKRAVTTRMTAKTTSQLLGPALHTSLHYLHKRLRSFLLLLLLLHLCCVHVVQGSSLHAQIQFVFVILSLLKHTLTQAK